MRAGGGSGAGREPAANRLFTLIVVVNVAATVLLQLLASAGVELQLPLVLALTMGEILILIPTVIYMAVCRVSPRGVSQRWRLPLAAVPILILMAYCMMPFMSLLNLVSMLIGAENAVNVIFEVSMRLPLAVMLLCVAVIPAFLEEFVFRGLIYGAYRKRRTWGAILCSALLFGLMHMNLNQFGYAFAMGVIFALLYEATGSLTASMLVHFIFNGNSVVMMYLMERSGATEAAGGAADAEAMLELLGEGAGRYQIVMLLLLLAVIALVGLAAVGGLYVALVKICHRKDAVLLLFRRNAMEKRRALELCQGGRTDARENDEIVSDRLWGPVLGIGIVISVGVIIWNFL